MQEQIEMTDAQASLLDRVFELFSDNVLTVMALAAVGMLVSIATVGGLRMVLTPVDEMPPADRSRRALLLKRVGFGSGAIWTFLIVLGYITASNLIAKVVVALGVGMIAGAGTPRAYDVLRWCGNTLGPAIGQWILGRLKAMFGGRQDPPPPSS